MRVCPLGSRGGDQGGREGRLLLLTRLHPAGAQHRHGGTARGKFSKLFLTKIHASRVGKITSAKSCIFLRSIMVAFFLCQV